jgi:hypothetical protein
VFSFNPSSAKTVHPILAPHSQKLLHDLAHMHQYLCGRRDSQLAKSCTGFVAVGTAHINHMDNKFAGRDEQQSGQRFLDSSAPRFIRHVESCETAGGDDAPLVWDTYPLPAGKDQKLSREFEGRALISAEGTVSSSLDLLSLA